MATVLSARASYVAVILLATVVQVVLYPELAGARSRLRYALDPALTWHDAYDAIRNVFLFAGLGAIWLVTSPPTRLREAVWRGTVTGALLSASVEMLQVFTPLRVASIADVVTNSLGTFVGALGAGLVVAAVRSQRGHRSTLGIPLFLFAIGNAGALLAEVLSPRFRSAAVAGVVGGPRGRLLSALHRAEPVTLSNFPPVDVLLAIPAGAFALAALVELGLSRIKSFIMVLCAGALTVAALEASHGIAGRAVDWSSTAASILGIAIGAAAAAWAAPRLARVEGARAARWVAAVTVAVITLWSWRPFALRNPAEIAGALASPNLVPLRAYPFTEGLLGVGVVIQLASLGLMAGALLAVWPVRIRGPLSYVWPAAWLALILELGHAFMESSIVDITSFLILFAGAWLGDAVMRRAGFTRYGLLGNTAPLHDTTPSHRKPEGKTEYVESRE